MININGRNRRRTGSAGIVCLLFLGLPIQLFAWQTAIEPSKSDQQARDARLAFATELETLAAQCQEQDMPDKAAIAKRLIVNRDPSRQYIFIPPAFAPRIEENSTDSQKSFHNRLKEIRNNYAERLFQAALTAASESRGPTAYQWFHEVLTYDPDHEEARQLLGFRNHYELGWVRSAKATRAKKARIRQKIIGWEKGTYWEVDSPHFRIYSAAGEDEGLKLAAELEQTYWVWRQVFFDYWCSTRQLNQWIEGSGSDKSTSRQYKIILFRDREHYYAGLSEVPNIERSSGYYIEKQRASFFFADEESPVATWRHETIHQLLQENAGASRTVADRGHAWLVEGIAMYFESMQTHEHFITLGGFDAERLQHARLRCMREGFYVPMHELDAMERQELQEHPEAGKLYSQASGISQFLFAGDNGRYRNNFVKFVKEFYKDRKLKSELSERTMSLDQLDRKYREFLTVTAGELNSRQFNKDARVLALGRANLKDDDVRVLKQCTNLDWLELSDNPLGDTAVEFLADMDRITQLFLDVTGVTDDCADVLVQLTTLQELDLASTRFTDAGVAKLTGLPDLQVLWLAGSQVSDGCIEDLVRMPNLKLVDLRQTKVTEAGVQKLNSARRDLRIMH